MTPLRWIFGIFLIAALARFAEAQGSEHGRTVLDGVFTAAQAERGKGVYTIHCSSCHMDDLSGLAAPARKGQQLPDKWRVDSVKSLFTIIQTRMPQSAP